AAATSSHQSAGVSRKNRERGRRGRLLMPRPRTIARMTSSRQDVLCLWLVLVLPSSFVVHKYLGWEGTIVYSLGVAASVALGRRVCTRLSTRTLVWLVLLASVLVAVAFVVVYPIANTHA